MRNEDKRRLGKAWRKRLEAALDTLIDAEGALKDVGCRDASLADVCEAIRNALDSEEGE